MHEKKSTHLVIQPNDLEELKKLTKRLFYVAGDDESSKSVFSFERNLLKDNSLNEIVVKHRNK